jgi:GTPase SAR1 family protein
MVQLVASWVEPQLKDALTRLPRLIDLPMTAVCLDQSLALPEGTSPLEVFRQCRKQLLVLGDPGAGKSILTLRMMCDLLRITDPSEPVPVPITLPPGRPAPAPKEMINWLARKVRGWFAGVDEEAVNLLRHSRVVPCLEGLDSVAEEHREGWVTAIRRHLTDCPGVPMVVTSRATTVDRIGVDFGLAGTVSIQPLSAGALDNAITATGEVRHRLSGALADNPSLREWCTTPLMLSVLAAVEPGDWDAPPLDDVAAFADASDDPCLHEVMNQSSAQARQNVREQYAVLRSYVRKLRDETRPDVEDKTPPARQPRTTATPLAEKALLNRGLPGLAKAMRVRGQEHFDTVSLLAASDPAEARRIGERYLAPDIKQHLFTGLAWATVITSTHSYGVKPEALMIFVWIILTLWYTRVYGGGLLMAPALPWVGRWTHPLARQWQLPFNLTALAFPVVMLYALAASAPPSKAALIAASMSGAVLFVGLGTGLIKFRVRSAAAEARRGLPYILARALVAAGVLGPCLAAVARWCANLAAPQVSHPAGSWVDDAIIGGIMVFAVAGGFALMRHTVDRILLVSRYRLPWRLSVFLSVAAKHGFLVATGSGYKFTHSTIRSAVEVALIDRPVSKKERSEDSSPPQRMRQETVFDAILSETLALHAIRHKAAAHPMLDLHDLHVFLVAQQPALLSRASRFQRLYCKAFVHAAYAIDPQLRDRLPLVFAWLTLGTSPLWQLLLRNGMPVSALKAVLLVGLALFLLIASAWAAVTPADDKGRRLMVLAASVISAMIYMPFGLQAVLDNYLGPTALHDIGGWRSSLEMSSFGILPGAAAAIGYAIGWVIDLPFSRSRVTWAHVDVAFADWQAALRHELRSAAHAHLSTAHLPSKTTDGPHT